MRRIVTALGALLLAAEVSAGELGLVLNGRSFHLGVAQGDPYNEENWGAGVQYEWEQIRDRWRPFAQVGGFIDSNHNNSYYSLYGYLHPVDILTTRNGGFTTEMGFFGLAMSRQVDNDRDLIFGILPVLSMKTEYASLNVTYIPKYKSSVPALFFLQVVIPMGYREGLLR